MRDIDKNKSGTDRVQKITPFLWFDNKAEEAVNFYRSIFKNSKIISISRYGAEGFEIHKMPPGTVMTIEFQIEGQRFIALNGGPVFKFNEAVSFVIDCKTQKEIDYYWEKLSEGGDETAQQCGWLKDKYGLSWQIVPAILSEMQKDKDKNKVARVTEAFLKMKKFDIKKLKNAYEGR